MRVKNALSFLRTIFIGSIAIVAVSTSANSQTKAKPDKEGFVQIFDGKTLNGWEGDGIHWSVDKGELVGKTTLEAPLKTNTFIVWQGGQPGDFELKASFKMSAVGNSGIQYRSVMFPDVPNAMAGYQADIDAANRYTGQNYEERGRTTLAYRGQRTTIPDAPGERVRNAWSAMVVDGYVGDTATLKNVIKTGDWNDIRIVAKGNHLQHYINGVLMSDVTDNDPAHRKNSGLIGIQCHVGPPMEVRYRNIRLKELK
jgi:hypothetical protein